MFEWWEVHTACRRGHAVVEEPRRRIVEEELRGLALAWVDGAASCAAPFKWFSSIEQQPAR
jgi:predicted ATPase